MKKKGHSNTTIRTVKIRFVDAESIDGRVLTNLTFFDEDKWHMWVPTPDGLHPLLGQPAEAGYFAKNPEGKYDMYLDFMNFMTQRACWIEAIEPIEAMQCDIHNLGASLAKIDLFYKESLNRGTEIARFVSTEIEYIFGVCRSLFDLLQKIIQRIWGRATLVDKTIIKKNLPDSFRKMVISNRSRMSIDQIVKRWNIPTALAAYYHKQASFFEVLRSYRDQIAHHGRDLRLLFVTEKGFAVVADTEPFSSFNVWNDEHMQENRLASLRPVLAHVITETLRACEEFTEIIQKIIKFPSDIVPSFKLFMRGYHNKQFFEMKHCLEKCLWWDTEQSTTV